ncbi:MAG: sigma factor [Armatimonadota bacterium]|nr:sigma factor [Armatimonadota bacterium]
MTPTQIAELIERVRSGQAAAYEELVRRFQHRVFALAYGRLLDFEAARDVTQETFIRAYERLGDLRDVASFPGRAVRHRDRPQGHRARS